MARQLVPTLVSGFVFAPLSSVGAVISYLNNAPYLALAFALVGVVGTIGGTYFGIRVSSRAREGARSS